MIANKKEFMGGLGLLAAFFLVLFIMFQPLFNGQNAMAYLDDLYNSISKGSAYYIDDMRKEVFPIKDDVVDVELTYASGIEARQAGEMLTLSGIKTRVNAKTVSLSGPLGKVLVASLDDADLMYNNAGTALQEKYGLEARRVMFNWWSTLKLLDKALKKGESFKAAKVTGTIQKKAVEASYNYYEIEPVNIMDKLWTVIFSLAFYVAYTLWFGFAILFVFEGWGLNLSH